MKDKFRLVICSDVDYEGMVVDICYGNEAIGILNQDRGVDNIEILLSSSTNEDDVKFPLKDFQEILEKAKKVLIRENTHLEE